MADVEDERWAARRAAVMVCSWVGLWVWREAEKKGALTALQLAGLMGKQ